MNSMKTVCEFSAKFGHIFKNPSVKLHIFSRELGWSVVMRELIILTDFYILLSFSSFLPHEAMLSAVFAVVVCLSVYLCVCVCVCHTPVLYQNG